MTDNFQTPSSSLDLVKELQSLTADLESRNRELLSRWKETQPLQAESLSEHSSAESDVRDFGQSFLQVQSFLVESVRNFMRAREEIESLRLQNVQIQENLARFTEQILNLSQERDTLLLEKQKFEQELNSLLASNREAEKKIMDLEFQVSERERDLDALAAKINQEEKEKAVLEETARKLDQGIKDLESFRAQLQSRVDLVEKHHSDLRALVEPLQSELAQSRQTILDLEAERDRLKQMVDEMTARQSEISTTLNIQSDQIRELENERTNLLSGRDAMDEANRAFQIQIGNLQTELAKIQKELQSERKIREAQAAAVRETAETLRKFAVSQVDTASALNFLTPPLPDNSDQVSYESHDSSMDRSLGEASADSPPPPTEAEEKAIVQSAFTPTGSIPEEETIPSSDLTSEPPKVVTEDYFYSPTPMDGHENIQDQNPLSEAFQPNDETMVEESFSVSKGDNPAMDFDVRQDAIQMSDSESAERVSVEVDKVAAYIQSAYPEISGAGMENFRNLKVLLIGGDSRFKSDYEHFFEMVRAEMVYFPSIIQLERQGMKRHVRDNDLVVVFGGGMDESGMTRLREICEDYSRRLVEHRSSGLVSLYHRLQEINEEI